MDTVAMAQGERRVGWARVTASKMERDRFKGSTDDI